MCLKKNIEYLQGFVNLAGEKHKNEKNIHHTNAFTFRSKLFPEKKGNFSFHLFQGTCYRRFVSGLQ